MERVFHSFRRMFLNTVSFLASLLEEGRASGSGKFSIWRFCRSMVRKHSSFLLYALICILAFIIFNGEYSFGAGLLFLVFCISGWVCTAPWEKRLAASSLVLLTILDYHFSMHYRRVFHEIGNQALVALQITDKDEVAA